MLGRGQGLTIDVDHQDRLLVEGERVRILLPVCRLVPVSCISRRTRRRGEPERRTSYNQAVIKL